MSDLRDELIEDAAARMESVIKAHPVPKEPVFGMVGSSFLWGVSIEEVAAEVVDAVLDTLDANADEWDGLSVDLWIADNGEKYPSFDGDRVKLLLAVLREGP